MTALEPRRDSIGACSVALWCVIFWQSSVFAEESAPIVAHDAGLRSCPALECPVVVQLSILDTVIVQNRISRGNNETDENGGWVQVAAADSRQAGWIIEGYLGYPHKFAPARMPAKRQDSTSQSAT